MRVGAMKKQLGIFIKSVSFYFFIPESEKLNVTNCTHYCGVKLMSSKFSNFSISKCFRIELNI